MTREEAIKILDIMQLKYVNDDGTPKFDTDEFEALKMAIEALKKEQRKTAKWIPVRFGDCKCSLCGETYGIIGSLLGSYNYCPNCGVPMEVEK